MKIYFGAGLNEWQTPNIAEAAKGSYNFELSKDSYKLVPRKPFDLKGTAPNAGDIRGIMQLVKRDDTETTLIQAGSTVYKWDGSSTWTNVGSCTSTSQYRDTYWSLGDYLVITDLQKNDVVKKWDGTTLSTITTGLGTSLYAKYGIVHKGRVWLFNVKTTTDTPHLMVASAFEDPTSYSTSQRAVTGTFATGLEAFYMLTPDLRPINGVALTLAGDLIVSTVEGRMFKLTGSTATDYKWVDFYPGSQAVGTESICSIGNDVVYMRKGGNIESLVATQNYGDVAADDLSRWIPDTVRNLAASITVYDQQNQKVYFFVSDKVLVLFKDVLYGGATLNDKGEKGQLSPWSVYKTGDSASFNTAAAKYMRRPGTTQTSVFFGADDGRVFDLNGEGLSGDAGSSDIQTVRKSRLIDQTEVDFLKSVTKGTVQYRRLNEVGLNVELDFADEYATSTASITLKGPPTQSGNVYFGGSIYFGGSHYFGQGFAFADRISHQNFSFAGSGTGATVTVSLLTPKQFQIDNIELT